MTIRVVLFSRWDSYSFSADAFLFFKKTDAIAYVQELLSDEYERNAIEEKYFKQKTEECVKYFDDFGTYSFEILVEPKEIG